MGSATESGLLLHMVISGFSHLIFCGTSSENERNVCTVRSVGFSLDIQ